MLEGGKDIDVKLNTLDSHYRILLSAFIIVLTIGVTLGLFYVMETTGVTPDGTIEQFNGSESSSIDIPDKYAKRYSDMLLTTHNHIISFSIIFILLGFIFIHNSILSKRMTLFLVIEPFLATISTFGSLWLIRYCSPSFVWLTIISSTLLYTSFYIIIVVSIYDLLFNSNQE